LLASDCKLPEWPYKTQGLQIYGAIRDYVRAYLALWYGSNGGEHTPSGGVYGADAALRNWRGALHDEYRATALMGPNAPFENVVTACTNIIWTCGPQHSAVNYPQYPFLADAKTLPFCIQLPGRKPFDPSREQILDQASVIVRLARFRYDQLGYYSGGGSEYGDLGDPNKPWKPVVERFQQELKNGVIHPNQPLWEYRFLSTENITNAISI
jgi:arachidonate 15-lipoxygenase